MMEGRATAGTAGIAAVLPSRSRSGRPRTSHHRKLPAAHSTAGAAEEDCQRDATVERQLTPDGGTPSFARRLSRAQIDADREARCAEEARRQPRRPRHRHQGLAPDAVQPRQRFNSRCHP